MNMEDVAEAIYRRTGRWPYRRWTDAGAAVGVIGYDSSGRKVTHWGLIPIAKDSLPGFVDAMCGFFDDSPVPHRPCPE